MFLHQVGSRSPYGEGRINIFDTTEIAKQGKKKNMSGAGYIREWIMIRMYSTERVKNYFLYNY